MAALWRAVAHTMRRGGPERTGHIALGRTRDGARVLRVTGMRTELAETWRAPMMVLDALLNPDDVRSLWPHADVKPYIAVAAPHQRIVQVDDRAFAKSMMAPLGKEATTERGRAVERRRAKVRRRVCASILKITREAGGETLVIGNRDIVKSLNLPPAIHIAWFNSVAGRDQWQTADGRTIRGEDFRNIIIVGRAQPKPADVERMAGAVTGQAPHTVDGWYPRRDVRRLVRQGSTIREVLGEADAHPDVVVERHRQRIWPCRKVLAFTVR